MKHVHGQLGNHIIMVPLRILRGGGGGEVFLWIINDTFFLWTNNLSLLFLRKLEDKYNLIIQYLRDPTGCKVDPNFKFWVKDKKFAIKDMSGIGVADVVVAPVPQSKSKVRIFLI